ncbi:unnamed protein product, partial [Candidula unifasciata]
LVRLDGSKLEVGDRVVCDNHKATIRFIGQVPPTKGIWLGVEWDDPSRGRHDGCHEGVRYFQTSHPKSGSFVRPTKVDGGITALRAVNERYGLKNDAEAGVKTEELFVLDQYLNPVVVEMVGAKKVNMLQSQFNKLKKISMFDMKVYAAGPEGELGRLCPNVTDLDVSSCLFSSWERVSELTCQMSHLKDLNVSENRLLIPKDPTSLSPSFARVQNLTLNQMNITWKEVLAICSMFPALEELHCSFNNIVYFADASSELKGLKILDLMTNNIQDWNEVLKLGNLQRLETLIISENKIKSIFFPDCSPTEKTAYFPRLKAFIIKRNEISCWSSVNELNKLQNLEELQVAENPILRTYNLETVRQLFVAKIGNLKLFSRTPITYEERKGAEIDYLKRFGSEWKLEGGHRDSAKNHPSDKFVADHPRYQAIVEKWGAPEDSELVEKSTALKENLLAINIFSPQYPDRGTLSKKLPGTMSIEKLKTLIQRLYKESTEPKLKYVSHKIANAPEIELDNDMRQLGFFSIEPGDTILVSW